MWHDQRVLSALSIIFRVVSDLISWFGLLVRPRKSLEAEILFLRRQLALYVERGVKPRRFDAATRASLDVSLAAFRMALGASRSATGNPDSLAPGGALGACGGGRLRARPLPVSEGVTPGAETCAATIAIGE